MSTQHSHPRKIKHPRVSGLLADGIRFLVPLALVLLLCLLGIVNWMANPAGSALAAADQSEYAKGTG